MSRLYIEGRASEHPDVAGQTEFQKKADEELTRRRKERLKKTGPQLPSFLKKEEYVVEREMTSTEKKEETKLKKKYDDSGMKASMIKQYGPKKGKQVYFATIRKQAMKEALVDYGFAKTYEDAEAMYEAFSEDFKNSLIEEYIEEKARGTRRKTTAHMYDMDETLFGHDHSKVKVHIHDKDGNTIKTLSNQEFNDHKFSDEEKESGHHYNFDEFRSSKVFGKSAKPLKKMIKHLNRQKARGYDTHIVTARSDMDNQPAFAKYLLKYGIQINPNTTGSGHTHVHRTGNLEGSDVGVKKRDTLERLSKERGYKKIHMYDDAKKVLNAVQNTPGVEVKTHMVKPRGESDEVRARSFRATETQQKPTIKADFEMWVDGLLNEGYDLSDYTWDELAEYFTEKIADVKPYLFKFTNNSEKIKKEEVDISLYEYWKKSIK
jgi:phosphoglycolate phosphatase-like HAD superfamily hydrolase